MYLGTPKTKLSLKLTSLAASYLANHPITWRHLVGGFSSV